MKSLSPELLAHLAQDTTTTCTLWKITRLDNKVYTFTDLNDDLTYQGLVYLAATGFSTSNIVTSDILNVDNLEVNSILSSDTITDIDIIAGLWDYATIEIFKVNYKDLTMGIEWMRKGTIGVISTGRSSFIAELRGLTQHYQQTIGRTINAMCDADFCDIRTPSVPRCKLNPATFTFTGTVTAVTSNSVFAISGLSNASGYFTGGLLTWTGGLNNTYQKEVKVYTVGNFELIEPMPNNVAIGDTVSVIKGCNKTDGVGGCNDSANGVSNIINFRGFNTLPGRDRLLSGT